MVDCSVAEGAAAAEAEEVFDGDESVDEAKPLFRAEAAEDGLPTLVALILPG